MNEQEHQKVYLEVFHEWYEIQDLYKAELGEHSTFNYSEYLLNETNTVRYLQDNDPLGLIRYQVAHSDETVP